MSEAGIATPVACSFRACEMPATMMYVIQKFPTRGARMRLPRCERHPVLTNRVIDAYKLHVPALLITTPEDS